MIVTINDSPANKSSLAKMPETNLGGSMDDFGVAIFANPTILFWDRVNACFRKLSWDHDRGFLLVFATCFGFLDGS